MSRKIVHIPDDDGRGMSAFQLFKECHIFQNEVGEWYVEIDAHDKALPLMFDFKNRYFKYELWNALRLKSPNQVRMYEILKQYESLGNRELTIAELRELIGISKNEYSGRTGWSDFKKYVLDSCQQALKESTDICYTYERGKVGKGGKWLSVVFHISKNADYVDQLTLEEFINMQPKPEPLSLGTEIEPNEFEKTRQYENKNIAFLAEACNNEFTETQMNNIFQIIVSKPIPEMSEGIWFSRFHYLSQQYAKMNVYAEKNHIPKRYGYFIKMLENDNGD
ncbi:MAG: replication initiation protein [Ruminococcus flavefaciens]|nr:replication initiation protein [Ruminococcus flavefaciens]MCM1061517.1 replication initiation protein [Eubacterium sp.]